MRVSALQTLVAFGYVASAVRVLAPVGGVYRRQSFDPDEELFQVEDCTDFGPTYVECVAPSPGVNRLCINPAAGQSCCDNQWGCPANSFCLIQDLCCPNGLDPESCAAENNVDLPDDFGESKPATDEPTVSPTDTEPPTEPTGEPSGEPTEPPSDGTTPPVQAGASSIRAGILGAIVGLAAFAL